MTTTILALLLLAAATPLLHRDLREADRKRRLREFLRTNPQALKIRRDFEEVSRQVGEQLMPAMREMATAMTKAARIINEGTKR